jgi:hypothetical protein
MMRPRDKVFTSEARAPNTTAPDARRLLAGETESYDELSCPFPVELGLCFNGLVIGDPAPDPVERSCAAPIGPLALSRPRGGAVVFAAVCCALPLMLSLGTFCEFVPTAPDADAVRERSCPLPTATVPTLSLGTKGGGFAAPAPVAVDEARIADAGEPGADAGLDT